MSDGIQNTGVEWNVTAKGMAFAELVLAMTETTKRWHRVRHAALGGCTKLRGVTIKPPMPNLEEFVSCTEELNRAAAAFRMYYDVTKTKVAP